MKKRHAKILEAMGASIVVSEGVPVDAMMLVPTDKPQGWDAMGEPQKLEWLARHGAVITHIGTPQKKKRHAP